MVQGSGRHYTDQPYFQHDSFLSTLSFSLLLHLQRATDPLHCLRAPVTEA